MDALLIPPSSRSGGEPLPAPSEQAVYHQLEKILRSRVFRSGEGQRTLLRYLVEQSLQGRGDQLKEYSIGIEVFHRKETFNPKQDNVVRAQAHKMRGALAKYYQGEGLEDPIRIKFPLGAYLPVFELAPPPKLSKQWPDFLWDIRWRAATALLIVLLLSGATVYILKRPATTPVSATPSIAVLPFRILTSDKEEEFFSDGLTEDLTDSLAQIPGMRVVAPSSAFQFRGKDLDVREVGRRLNVGVVLEGSVRKFENRVRITTLLSDTKTGFHLWSSSYDREIKDVLLIQRQISDAITTALGVRLVGAMPGGSQTGSANLKSADPEAYQDYLRGRYFWAKQTLKSLDTAVGYFEKAIAKDPAYVPAYAGLAHCYASIPIYSSTTSKDLIPKIRATALKALSLDGNLGEAHVDLARAYTYDYQWSMAEQEFKKALELSPGVAVVHQWYGSYLIKMGRLKEALAEYQTALSLDPMSPNGLARPLYFMRQYDKAIQQYKASLEFDPNSAITHEALGIAYVVKGMPSQGITEMELGHSLIKENSWIAGQLGYAYAVTGKTSAAREILETLLHQRGERGGDPLPALAIAHVYTGLGNKDEAFAWLQKAVDEWNVNLALKADPIYDSLRGDPRFAGLLRRMNL